MQIRSEFERLIHWVRSQITLRRKWYLYVFCLFIFIVGTFYHRDTYLFQVGVTLFSIAIVYLVMEASNIELKATTERQIKAFVENLQMVCSELKNVSNRIDTLTVVMKDVQTTILESTLASKTAIAKAEAERRKRKESIKPQLSIKVVIKGIQLWIFDNRRYHLFVWNSGSDAIGTVVRIGNKISEAHNIGTRKQIDIDIGHIKDFKGISVSDVLIEVRDVDRNPYQGNVQVSLPQPQWIAVPLTEM